MSEKRVMKCALICAFATMLSCLGLRDIMAAGPDIITNMIGMKLIEIPAGEFLMGAEEDQADTLNTFPYCNPKWLDCELPRHKVRITKPFYMGQHEVTLGEFLTFYHETKYKIEAERDGKPSWGYENGNLVESNRFRPWDPIAWKIEIDHPAIYVTWIDAAAFCEWLSKKEAQTYGLPTEAQWEYACRAGTNSRYHFGDDPEQLIRFANGPDADRKALSQNATIASFDKNGKKTNTGTPFPFLSQSDGYPWTAPVGKFRPNAFGLYDMHGNAVEWCSDWYDENYYKNSPNDDPQGPSTGSSRVLRGGGYFNTPVSLRCARRGGLPPSNHYFNIGFRVVRVR